MRAHERARVRRAIGTVVDLPDGSVAIRGHDPSTGSLEVKGIHVVVVPDEPATVALVTFKGHAGATRPMLDIHGVDALIDELTMARERMEDAG